MSGRMYSMFKDELNDLKSNDLMRSLKTIKRHDDKRVIYKDKEMFATFKETTSGMVATIGGKLNQPSGIGTVE